MDAYYELSREIDDRIVCAVNYNDTCSPHFHSNIEIVYVEDGEINAIINGCSKTMTAGCLCVVGSYDVHAYMTHQSSRIILFVVPAQVVGSFANSMRGKAFAEHFMEDCEKSREIHFYLQKMFQATAHYDQNIMKGFAYIVLGMLSAAVGLKEKTDSGGLDTARKILSYMQEHYTESITIAELSKVLGYNKDYLSRFFHTYLGIGFNFYLNNLRVRHAAELIRASDMGLSEVAYQSGFGNYRTFFRAFEDIMGMTPFKYKKQAC